MSLFNSACKQKHKSEKSIPESSLWDVGEYDGSISKHDFAIHSLGSTSDNEHIFSTVQISELDSIIHKFEKETTNQIAIVTLDSSVTTKEKFDSLVFTIDSLRYDNSSRSFPYETVVAIRKALKKVRISNSHLSTKLPADDTKKIIDDFMLPKFEQGNYFDGTKNGLMALVQKNPLPRRIVFTKEDY